jgi:hypothetical protein
MDVERERVCRLEKGRGLEEPFSFLERERERERREERDICVQTLLPSPMQIKIHLFDCCMALVSRFKTTNLGTILFPSRSPPFS